MSDTEPSWVFAYGSNMHLADLRRWFRMKGRPEGTIVRVEAAELSGWRLVWNYYSRARVGGAANIEPAAGDAVHGAALLVDDVALEGIDAKEGHPGRYDRGSEPRDIRLRSGARVPAWVYVVRPEFHRSPVVAPTREYLELMIGAGREHGLPDAYLAQLLDTPTVDG